METFWPLGWYGLPPKISQCAVLVRIIYWS